MCDAWPFDQEPNVASITTRQVIELGFPVLTVVHYSDDHSWAFMCGTTDDTDDGRVICMKTAFDIGATLATIADLPPGWIADRQAVGGEWVRQPNPDDNESDGGESEED